jgi:hypothetical protein
VTCTVMFSLTWVIRALRQRFGAAKS